MGLRGKWGSKGTRRELRRSPHPSPPPRWPLYRHLSLLGLLTGTFSEGTLVKEVCLSRLPIKKRPNVCHFVEICSYYEISFVVLGTQHKSEWYAIKNFGLALLHY